MKTLILGIALLMGSLKVDSAEYLGSDIDGEAFSCSAILMQLPSITI